MEPAARRRLRSSPACPTTTPWHLGASTWRHVAFVERPSRSTGRPAALLVAHALRRLQALRSAPAAWRPARPAPSSAPSSTRVYVQPDVCNGCGYCVVGCPFGVIDRREDDGRAWKCTLCYDRLKGDLEPACAKACPTDSILFGEVDELREQADARVAELHERGRRRGLPLRRDAPRPARHRGAERLLPAGGQARGLQPAAGARGADEARGGELALDARGGDRPRRARARRRGGREAR